MVVILYNIRSLHNVGSIFRTADAAGVKKIYLCGITPAPIDKFGRKRRQIAKVSLGAEDYVPWEQVKSTTRLLDKLKKDGCLILAIEQSAKSIPYFRLSFPPRICHSRVGGNPAQGKLQRESRKTVLVLGNEISGLPYSILNRADKILEIPMKGKKESLNVAVAFGIIVFNFVENRSRI